MLTLFVFQLPRLVHFLIALRGFAIVLSYKCKNYNLIF